MIAVQYYNIIICLLNVRILKHSMTIILITLCLVQCYSMLSVGE